MPNFKDKTILITGGTGSFGRALLDRLLNEPFGEIRIFSRDELKQDDMRNKYKRKDISFYIGDVRDRKSIKRAMRGVDYVFHAAALKQVPSCEFFPNQAVMTNILGSENTMETAINAGVSKVVCLSTDKAVYPINAMGMTKALMEKFVQAAARDTNNSTTMSVVRYGNVMCSRGSVIPLFIRQITQGDPITVTCPDMTRFLLSLKDAIELVLFAFENASSGDIFIKKSPACTIIDLAQALKNLFASNVEIRTIGIRHGEKLYETLATREELRKSDEMDDYFRVAMDVRDLNYSKYFHEGDQREAIVEDYHSHNTYRLNVEEVEKLLINLPEVKEMVELHRGRGN